MVQPPPLPSTAKSPGLARWLDLAVPGAGLFYLGRRGLGAALALPFLACFVAALALFVVSYARYVQMATSDNLLQGDQLESFGDIFPTAWLIALAGVGGLLQVCSMVLLRRARRADAARTPPPPPAAKA
jgi:hypothetical protein